jgi:hypothetical protein
MNNVTKILLENGLKGLANKDEEYFKQNITHAIALKLNESLKYIYDECTANLFKENKLTESTAYLTEFVSFVENFKEGKYKFKNNSTLNINESQVAILKELFDSLSPKSRKIMVESVFSDSQNFKDHIEFYNKIKGLIK